MCTPTKYSSFLLQDLQVSRDVKIKVIYPKEGLPGGCRSQKCNCFYFWDKANDPFFACVGKIFCLPFAAILSIVSLGKLTNLCCDLCAHRTRTKTDLEDIKITSFAKNSFESLPYKYTE